MSGIVPVLEGAPLPHGAILIVLLALTSFFAGTEAALLGLQAGDRRELGRAGPSGAQVLRLLGKPQALGATLLLGHVGARLAFAVGAIAAAPLRPWAAVAVVTAALVLATVTPRALVAHDRLLWSRLAVWPLTALHVALTPARLLLMGLVGLVGRVLGAPEPRVAGLAEDELLTLIDHGTAAGALDPMERDIIEAVFELDELTVDRVMTPRPDIFSVPLTIPWDELLRAAREQGLSRIPVYAGRTDEIVGVLLLKDLLKHLRAPPAGPRQLRSLLLPPVFVPSTKPADATLREFLAQKLHMAFVVDEHGTVEGLVTLDDLLRELVGELDGDTEERDIARITPESLTVKASIDLEDFADEIGIALPEGDYHTLGGFVFHQLGRLPRAGDTVVWEGHAFTVTAMEGRRIAELAVDIDVSGLDDREVAG